MRKFNIIILLLTLVVGVGAFSWYMSVRLTKQSDNKEEVYLVIKTLSENAEFWNNVQNGAEVAATELGVKVIVEGPAREIYIDEQIEIIEEIILKNPKVIAIAAVEYNALVDVCEKAINAGIAIVTFDSDVNIPTEHSFIATNNLSAARRIAHETGTLIDGAGTIAILSHVEGTFTSIERIEGFKRGINPFKNINVLPDIYYTDNNEENAYNAATKIIQENPNISALFAANEATLVGSGKAVRDLGKENEIIVVGFDVNEEIIIMIEQGSIDATMVQKPFNMGYIAIKEALEVLEGKNPSVIDTGAVMINKENMFLPENQKLIVPH